MDPRPAFGSALTLLVAAFAVRMRHVVWTWIQASDLISAMADRRSIMSAMIFSVASKSARSDIRARDGDWDTEGTHAPSSRQGIVAITRRVSGGGTPAHIKQTDRQTDKTHSWGMSGMPRGRVSSGFQPF